MATQLELQIEYANALDENSVDYTFAIGEAFVESMRSTHYKHTGTAVDELIDNAIEAGANTISVAFGFQKNGDKKPNAIAIIDNGHGMPPNMVRRAASWGGTHRHRNETREGMGRFGFGLPSASVNQGKRFTIFSKLRGEDWYAVTVDLDDVAALKYSPVPGKVEVPVYRKETPPDWVLKDVEENFPEGKLNHGTIVVWEKLDRLTWSTVNGLRNNLLSHFGTIYRNYLSQTQIVFDNTIVGAVDPLFITPGARFFDEDSQRAVALEPGEISVRSARTGNMCKIKVRFASMPLGFYSVDKSKGASGKNGNARFRVKNQNLGIVVCRMGRQIHVVDKITANDGTQGWEGLGSLSNNDDRYWGLEIDFPADLDEEFTISNSKQDVVMSDRIWQLLKEGGVLSGLKSLKRLYKEAKAADKSKPAEGENKPRPSELAAKEGSEQSRPGRVHPMSQERGEQAKKNFEEFYKNAAKERKVPENVAKEELEAETKERPYKVEFETMPDAPFYRMEQRGAMKVLKVNMAHRFYLDIYANQSATSFMRYALEVVLFSIGEGELDAIGNVSKESFYHVEKLEWSKKMNVMLGALSEYADEDDEEAA
ncbi:ATP-binding protein [Salipiger sp. H15]|uniref:ATP-binding protein n=1 Tax=Alloyangia sp. H15 TaxID=3029062 RepID=A0AAU8AJ27_9RHOB